MKRRVYESPSVAVVTMPQQLQLLAASGEVDLSGDRGDIFGDPLILLDW